MANIFASLSPLAGADGVLLGGGVAAVLLVGCSLALLESLMSVAFV
ncbi:hypothetical protein AALB_0386 [Agarivorans albus MKT 106]|uniref:Uncharacterized protein n=1 Tax=Agarivorans albus MKT 106 TaxID=1331007 RepID=R9PQD5_AGAAL|nr:hypothetical protein AALB_0386 [Agarivorans albus MKT 106]